MNYSNGNSFANGNSMDLGGGHGTGARDGTKPASSAWMFPGDPVWRI